MNRAEALTIKAGDLLVVDPCWNRHAGRASTLTPVTRAVDVYESPGCQTGVLITVQFTSGRRADLDAGWFVAKYDEAAANGWESADYTAGES